MGYNTDGIIYMSYARRDSLHNLFGKSVIDVDMYTYVKALKNKTRVPTTTQIPCVYI